MQSSRERIGWPFTGSRGEAREAPEQGVVPAGADEGPWSKLCKVAGGCSSMVVVPSAARRAGSRLSKLKLNSGIERDNYDENTRIY